MNNIPRLVITPGEPAGIGPDLLVQIAQTPPAADLVIAADPLVMQQRARQLGLPLKLVNFDASLEATKNQPGELKIISIPCAAPVITGKLNTSNADYVLETIRRATQGCLNGEFDAIVTAPLHKGIINDAGIPFTGHTEFLAELTQTELPVMMLATDAYRPHNNPHNQTSHRKAGSLRVALASTHLPLKDVSAAITRESLSQVIDVLHADLVTKFGISHPHILVCGLNPHAGEGGHLGMEEIETISPVLDAYRNKGMDLSGPLPADTLFTPKYLDSADAVLAMYHDQGLPVLKHVGFGNAVNITLGLPIIRTSVDHGTALDLAGTAKADSGSLMAAINAAIAMAQTAT